MPSVPKSSSLQHKLTKPFQKRRDTDQVSSDYSSSSRELRTSYTRGSKPNSSSVGDGATKRKSNYDGGRATTYARDQLKMMRTDMEAAHRVKLESMFSFLPTKLLQEMGKEVENDRKARELKNKSVDSKSSSPPYKNETAESKMKPNRYDFNGVVIMADLVKSTNLSEEMEDRAAKEDCGDVFTDSAPEDYNDLETDDTRKVRRREEESKAIAITEK